jgi:trk system potassium uptake protein TrkA
MYFIIVGAGSIGISVMKIALQDGHDVAIIERNEMRARETAQNYDAIVLHADVSHGSILDEAGVHRADALIATTSDDAINLMAMFLGREHEVTTLVSLVDEKEHQGMFERLGVQVLVDPEKILAQHLYNRLRKPKVEDVLSLTHGEQIFEAALKEQAPLVGKTIAEARQQGLLSKHLLIVVLRRGHHVTKLPEEDTLLKAKDHLIVFAQEPLDEAQYDPFTG